MAYFLAIEGEEKGKKKYKKVYYNGDKKGYSLEEVDRITTGFYNQQSFKDYLSSKGYIDRKDCFKPLCLVTSYDGKIEKTRYQFLYQRDADYLCNPGLLIKHINDKLFAANYDFLTALAQKYAKKPQYNNISKKILEAIRLSKFRQGIAPAFGEVDKNGDDLLTSFVKSIIYESFFDASGSVSYLKDSKERKRIDYSGLRSLIVFVDNMERKSKSDNRENKKPGKRRTRKYKAGS